MREPYQPSVMEWSLVFDMLCLECSKVSGCQICESMILHKDGGDWPDGGWVSDPGSGVTCLSYQPRGRDALPEKDLIAATKRAAPMCSECAARRGSDASVSLHTRRDFKAAVRDGYEFVCHHGDQKGRPCGGWAEAVKARQ